MQTKHFGQLVALSALWGASFMLIRVASPVMGPNVLALLRVGAATVTLGILMRVVQHRWPVGHWRELALLGALSVACPFLLFAWAALQLPAGYSALLNSTAVIFGIFASAWLKEDTLTVRKLVGCAFGFAGVALIVQLGPLDPTPVLLAAALACITASACYGISTTWMKRATQRMSPLAIAAGIHAAALVLLLPGAVWNLPQAQFTPLALAVVAVMGVVTSGLAYWLNLRVLTQVSPVAAMSSAFMIPLFGVAWGHLFLDEALGPGMLWGGALVLVATGLVTGFNPLRWLSALRPRGD